MAISNSNSMKRILLPLAAATILGVSGTALGQSSEQRLDRLEQLLESSTLMQMARQGDQLRSEIQRLTGELEQAQREIAELRSQQRSLFEDMDARLQDIEQNGGASAPASGASSRSSSGGSASGSGTPPVPDVPALEAEMAALTEEQADDAYQGSDDAGDPAPGNAVANDEGTAGGEETSIARGEAPAEASTDDAAEAAYRKAFNLLREGRYGAAGDGFRKVMEAYPNTRHADNARYWLGESYYVVRDFEAAMEHFKTVMNDPDNGKQLDAMLKAGYIQYELGDYDEARKTLEKIRKDFPDTTVATLAENRLRRIQEEGR